MLHLAALALAAAAAATPANARTITVVNNCPRPVYPVAFDKDSSSSQYLDLAPKAKGTFTVGDNWNGAVWARTGCNAADGKGYRECLTGTCGGSMCANAVASKVSLKLGASDTYLLDFNAGGNIPISVSSSDANCLPLDTNSYSNGNCPGHLRTGIDSKGINYACMTSCQAGWGGEAYGNRDCCTGACASSEKCMSCGVDWYAYWGIIIDQAYTYPYDSNGITYTCGSKPSYTVTFCNSVGSDFAGSTYDATTDEQNWGTFTANEGCMNTAKGGIPTSVKPSPTAIASTGTWVIIDASTIPGGIDNAVSTSQPATATSAKPTSAAGVTSKPPAAASKAPAATSKAPVKPVVTTQAPANPTTSRRAHRRPHHNHHSN